MSIKSLLFSKKKKPLKRRKYNGKDYNSRKAFNVVGDLDEEKYNLTGKRMSSKKRKRLYKKYRKQLEKENKPYIRIVGKNHKTHSNNKPLLKEPRNKASHYAKEAYRTYDKQFRSKCYKNIKPFKKAESFINKCANFIETARTIISSSKIVAFIRLSNDSRQLIISIIKVTDSINELIDIANTNDGSISSYKKEFDKLVEIIKTTKDIYDSLKDIAKQSRILLL